MRLMMTGAKLLAELSVSLPAELKTGETETTGCICCGLLFVLPADIFCGFAVVFWRKYGILYIQLSTCNLTYFVLNYICGKRGFSAGRPLAVQSMHSFFFFAKIAGKNSASNAKSRVIPPPSIAAKKIR